MILYIIFIIINKKKGIIKDTGYNKILLFSFGIIFFFISNYFATYTTYFSCSLFLLFKHNGVFMVACIFYIYNMMGLKLGITDKDDNKFRLILSNSISFDKSNATFTLVKNYNSSIYNQSIHNDEDENQIIEMKLNGMKSTEGNLNVKKNNIKKDNTVENVKKKENKRFKKNIKQVHSLFYEVLFIYAIYILSMIIIIIFYYFKNTNKKVDDYNINDNENDHIVQNKNGKWSYQCPLNDADLVYSTISLLFFNIVSINGKKISNYECIFKCTKYITYSTYISVTIGPLANVY